MGYCSCGCSRSRPEPETSDLRIVRILLLIVLVVLLLPYLLTPFYRDRPSGLDADGLALAQGRAGVAAMGRFQRDFALPAALGGGLRGRQILQPSRHRLGRAARRDRRRRGRRGRPAAARPSPSRWRKTCSCGRAAAWSARRWNCRWRCGSIWCCRSSGSSKSTSISPNSARPGSSAPRPAPVRLRASGRDAVAAGGGAAGGDPAQSGHGAAPASPGPGCVGWPDLYGAGAGRRCSVAGAKIAVFEPIFAPFRGF